MNQRGFTLIEIAIVLIIVTILLGYTMAMVPIQQELKQYRQADAEMSKIINSLYAFAQVNGYLPCPANNNVGSSGFECRDTDGEDGDCETNDPTMGSCDLWFGFVPGKTLGISGNYSTIGLLLDPWGQPYRYQVTDSDDEDTDGDGDRDGDLVPDMVLPGGIRITTGSSLINDPLFPTVQPPMNLALLSPDLVICNTDPSALAGNDTVCSNASEAVFGASATTLACTSPNQQCAPVVILSTGKDRLGEVNENIDGDNKYNSWVQLENLDNSVNDRVFIDSTFVDIRTNVAATDLYYDDVIKWISPNILYSKMIEAGQLP